MKKRTKVLIGVAAGVVVFLLLAGVMLLQPPVPYEFLRDARVYNVEAFSAGGLSPGFVKSPPYAVRRHYWLPQSFAEINEEMWSELEPKGWAKSSGYMDHQMSNYTRGPTDRIIVRPFPSGCQIEVMSEATANDRFQAWLWQRTHS